MIRQRTITDLNDPDLEPYREIRNRNWTEQSGWFIVEGPLLVEQLLESDYECQSVLLDLKYESQRLDELLHCGRDLEILRIEHDLVQELTGFHFHRGVMGCGLRRPKVSFQESLQERPLEHRELVAATHGIQDPENVGSLLRNCAGLGVNRVVMGNATADPFSRRALRVAMGTTLKLQICYSEDLRSELSALREQHALTVYAASLAENSICIQEVVRDRAGLVLFGNERHGLPKELYAQVDQAVKIQMFNNVDSLNVSVASGIILYELTRNALGPAC